MPHGVKSIGISGAQCGDNYAAVFSNLRLTSFNETLESSHCFLGMFWSRFFCISQKKTATIVGKYLLFLADFFDNSIEIMTHFLYDPFIRF